MKDKDTTTESIETNALAGQQFVANSVLPVELHGDSATSKHGEYVREIVVNYVGPRRRSPEFQEPAEVARFLRATLLDNSREHFIALFLDTRNRVIGYSRISIGNQDRCLVHVGEVFQKAVLVGAARMVVAHNHPSGHAKPSAEDQLVTDKLCKAGELLGIAVLDHLIFTDDELFSFHEHGLI